MAVDEGGGGANLLFGIIFAPFLPSDPPVGVPFIQLIFCLLTANVKNEDIVRSMFRTAIEGLAQMAYLNALAFGVRRIYFLGSFINIPLARELITTELEGRILLRPKVLILSLS